MRFAIVGAGGVGGYLGARLAEAGQGLAYLARGRSLIALREEGVTLKSPLGDVRTGLLEARDDPQAIGISDVVIVTVKLYDLDALAPCLAPLVGPETVVLPLQNGIEAHRILSTALPGHAIAKGTISVKSSLQSPGVIVCRSPFCRIRLAEADGARSERTQRLVDVFNTCIGIDAALSTDIDGDIWRKFIMLASFSAVACLGRAAIGQVMGNAEARSLLLDAAAEAACVARAEGISIPQDIAEMTFEQVKDMPPEGRASMLEDLEAGRRLELFWLSGAVMRLGKLHNVPTPVHETAYRALAMHSMGKLGQDGP